MILTHRNHVNTQVIELFIDFYCVKVHFVNAGSFSHQIDEPVINVFNSYHAVIDNNRNYVNKAKAADVALIRKGCFVLFLILIKF